LQKSVRKHAKQLRGVAQKVTWEVLDLFDGLLGRKDSMTPPRRMMNVGSNEFTRSDFHKIGESLLQLLTEVGGLDKDDKVLDVGCGVGRMAIPLTRVLSEKGSYDGFDIVEESIGQCTDTISVKHDNFRFHHASLFNSHYNPGGLYTAEQYQFPFADENFTFVFLTSVFTHMLSNEIENYLKEIYRVLKPGGRCFATFFLLTPESQALIAANRSTFKFVYPIENGMSSQEDEPEAAVAFDERTIRQMYADIGFSVIEPVKFGNWCDRDTDVGFQDIVVAEKPGIPRQ
jgi:ubiquinone/menaquinone biosynthesis C-methylase UbiE